MQAYDMTALQKRIPVSRSTLKRWMSRPDPVKRLHRMAGTSRVLVCESELRRWFAANTNTLSAATGNSANEQPNPCRGDGEKHEQPMLQQSR